MEELDKLKIELKLRGFSPLTVRNYSFFVEKFLLKTKKPDSELNEDDARAYLSELFDSKSKNTILLAAAALKFFYIEVLKKDFNQIKMPKKDNRLPEVLTPQEVQRLISSADNQKSRLIVSFLYSAGLRVSELVNLKVQDLDFGEKTGWVRRGKGSKDRVFAISEVLARELEEYLKGREQVYLFSKNEPLTTRNIQKIIKGMRERASIQKKVTPHTLRHSFATHLLEQGVSLPIIQELLGHKSLKTTSVYLHVQQYSIDAIRSPLDTLSV